MLPTIKLREDEPILLKRKRSDNNNTKNTLDILMRSSLADELSKSLRDRRWNRSRALLQSSDAATFVQYNKNCQSFNKDDNTKIGERDLLRCACYHYAPVDIVKSIYHLLRPSLPSQQHNDDDDADDKATTTTNTGWTALHEACCYSSEEVVSFLLDVNPKSTAVPDQEGKLPLYLAIEFRRSPSIIEKILRVHPTAVYAVDRCGTDPMKRFFCRWEGSLRRRNRVYKKYALDTYNIDMEGLLLMRTFLLLLRAHIYGRVVDADNNLDQSSSSWIPLLEALRYDDIPPEMLLFLLEMLPPELKEGNDDQGNFAAHVASSMISPMKSDRNAKPRMGI